MSSVSDRLTAYGVRLDLDLNTLEIEKTLPQPVTPRPSKPAVQKPPSAKDIKKFLTRRNILIISAGLLGSCCLCGLLIGTLSPNKTSEISSPLLTNTPLDLAENPQTVIVTQLILQTVEIIITATPIPPTETPVITPTPVFQKWTSSQVVEAFKAASLEAENTYPMTKDDFGMAPMVAVEATRFIIPSICPDCGGRIFNFDNPQNLEITKTYYETVSQSSAAFFTWIFVKDNILVQINGDLPESQALKYQDALNNLK